MLRQGVLSAQSGGRSASSRRAPAGCPGNTPGTVPDKASPTAGRQMGESWRSRCLGRQATSAVTRIPTSFQSPNAASIPPLSPQRHKPPQRHQPRHHHNPRLPLRLSSKIFPRSFPQRTPQMMYHPDTPGTQRAQPMRPTHPARRPAAVPRDALQAHRQPPRTPANGCCGVVSRY